MAEIGGEDAEILLAKPANKDQLEIARQIEKQNAVVVQGPPGTGKTHTIANLIGNFLSEGKSVLVTSYTKKALSVLKSQMTESIQDLCVSLLEDNQQDMGQGINGISRRQSELSKDILENDINILENDRNTIIKRIAEIRETIYNQKYQDIKSLVFNGESLSPIDAAKEVAEHCDYLEIIPGEITKGAAFPLNKKELIDLYMSNCQISDTEEAELVTQLPDPKEIKTAEEIKIISQNVKTLHEQIKELSSSVGYEVLDDFETSILCLKNENTGKQIHLRLSIETDCESLLQFCHLLELNNEWKQKAAYEGSTALKQKWNVLLDKIQTLHDFSKKNMAEFLEYDIKILDATIDISTLYSAFEQFKGRFNKKGTLGFFFKHGNKSITVFYDKIKIKNRYVSCDKECDIILNYLNKLQKISECSRLWKSIFQDTDMKDYAELGDNPDITALEYIEPINKYLNWYSSQYDKFKILIKNAGIQEQEILSPINSELKRNLKVIADIIPSLAKIQIYFAKYYAFTKQIKEYQSLLQMLHTKSCSPICIGLYDSYNANDYEEYSKYRNELVDIYAKYEIQHKRNLYLSKINIVAPEWANAIKNRIGLHGEKTVPSSIEDSWRIKQFNTMITEITNSSYSKIQSDNISLGRLYRQKTSQLVEKKSWLHLVKVLREDTELTSSLHEWSMLVKKIGKGTGKNAAMYRAKAREEMSNCQRAVPVWIMTINKALESLVPGENKYDVLIIDEASQADVTAVVLMYLAKKVIIVGDDKQVSPMAVGNNSTQITNLMESSIKDKIKGYVLWDLKTSIYDIASMKFPSRMLREHFRCVPEIIEFCNVLSYDGQIKPLRDTSKCNLQAVVNYRVKGHRTKTKTNVEEADAIVSLMRACIENPNYEGKTFGIISLLGDQQYKLILKKICNEIPTSVIDSRRIMCSDAAGFQGDERDVIFLSMVDSNEGDGPLRFTSDSENLRKRYNVSVSRAKDQLWVVNSLDESNDLKPNDIRRDLLMHANDPTKLLKIQEKSKEKSESVFEERVVGTLISRGFKIEQQYQVGAYRIDMVVIDGNKQVAIECDGEQYHSSELQIKNDMERQTILERLGWRFIRIRGCEYFRNPESTMDKVISEIEELDIHPSNNENVERKEYNDIVKEVKRRALELQETY